MVDILGIVCQMRLDRGGMIQTPEQYEFLHHVLALFESHLPHTPSSMPLTSDDSLSPIDTSTPPHPSSPSPSTMSPPLPMSL